MRNSSPHSRLCPYFVMYIKLSFIIFLQQFYMCHNTNWLNYKNNHVHVVMKLASIHLNAQSRLCKKYHFSRTRARWGEARNHKYHLYNRVRVLRIIYIEVLIKLDSYNTMNIWNYVIVQQISYIIIKDN